MQIRDRIKSFRRVPARDLLPNPKNWRTHPDRQRDILKGILAEIGYADALLARERDDGRLELIDGHLRAETTPDSEVPVLVLDLDEAEADKLLALLDPLAALAGTNEGLLEDLLAGIETQNAAVAALLDEMSPAAVADLPAPGDALKDLEIPELYQVLILCETEDDQRNVYERLRSEGLRCRILNL